MENASKALIMAGAVLLGVLILTVTVALFRSLGSSSAVIMEEIENARIAEFNNQFLKYYGLEEGITAHDIVTIINLANDYNKKLGIAKTSIGGGTSESQYLRLDVKLPGTGYVETNFADRFLDDKGEIIDKKVKTFLEQYSTKTVKTAGGKEEVQLIKYDVKKVTLNSSTGRISKIEIYNK